MPSSDFSLPVSQLAKRQRLKELALDRKRILMIELATAWEKHWILPTFEAKRRAHLDALDAIESRIETDFPDLAAAISAQRRSRDPKTLTSTQRASGIQMLIDLREKIASITKQEPEA